MLKRFRFILFPFAILWSFIIWLRNKLYDKKIIRSASFNIPIICIGNLSVGGTGKTPMTEYLIKILSKNYSVATLSRGYKRKTKGFIMAGDNATAADIGDEPMQLHQKFPQIIVAVCEERIIGIPRLLHEKEDTQVIILDDAFQHRQVKAGLNILLTDFNNLYTEDFMLPAGTLRDVRSSSKRANIIVVTKCKVNLTNEERFDIIKKLQPLPQQKVFFTTIEYETPYHLFTKEVRNLNTDDSVLVVCGIANPQILKEKIGGCTKNYKIISFKDHHIFSTNDIREIKNYLSGIISTKKMIITTEKDMVKLKQYQSELHGLPIYVLPMTHKILFDEENDFTQQILSFVKSYNAATYYEG